MSKVFSAARRLLNLSQKDRDVLWGDSSLASGMWTAAAGASAQAQQVDIVANNLANVDTLAFKKDLPTFKEYLATVEREKMGMDIPRSPIKDKDFYPLDGRDQSYVVVDGTYTNFKQGNMKITQAPLDVAFDGPGFLEVSTPFGSRYTRQGSLKLATDGRLVTSEGYPVLAAQPGGLALAPPALAVQPGQGGPMTQGGVAAGQTGSVDARIAAENASAASRYINLGDNPTRITISPSGEVYSGDEFIAKLSVKEFPDVNKLRKQGGGLYENKDAANQGVESQRTQVKQGMLETSNVNPIEEMTALIKANRLFEHDMKALRTYSEILTKEATEVGKL